MTAPTGCERCGRKLPPRIRMTRQWANERGYCLCGIPPEPVLTEPTERWMVYELLAAFSNGVHEWCGEPRCEICRK